MSEGCLFCAIAVGDIPATVVASSPHALAFRDVAPQAPTHVLVIPRIHVDNVGHAAVEDPALLGSLMALCAEVAESEGIATSGYRVVTNTGAHGGQSVNHLHFHVLGGRQLQWPPG